MIRELLQHQARHLDHFFAHIDIKSIDELVSFIARSQGALFLTGVGKSGAIAQKLASTFVSTGHRAHFLCPTNALHGDIGIVSPGDIVLFLSKSGESDELLGLLPHLKGREVLTAILTANPRSRLAMRCEVVVPFPLVGELGPDEVIPTTSSALQLILGDIVALGVMNERGVSLEQFAFNHPAGQLGRRLTLRVEDIMLRTEDLPTCTPNQSLQEALLILTRKRCGCLLIVDQHQKLLGIFTDGDLRRYLQLREPEPLDQPMHLLMNRHPKTIKAEAGAHDALQFMNKGGPITELPVVRETRLIGLLKMHDLVRHGL